MKRGHSNLYANETKPNEDLPEVAMISMCGGAQVYTVKELPPLALRIEEWREIGKRMNWTLETES